MIELELTYWHETDLAVLLGDTHRPDQAIWIPKSIIEGDFERARRGDLVSVRMPEWKAQSEGFI